MYNKGRKQQLTWEDYLVAFNLLYTNDGQILFEEKYYPQELPNAEIMLLRKEAFLTLSEDAKEVIKLIIDAPSEILCDIYDKASKMKIQKLLMSQKKWQKRKVRKAFKEIEQFTVEGL